MLQVVAKLESIVKNFHNYKLQNPDRKFRPFAKNFQRVFCFKRDEVSSPSCMFKVKFLCNSNHYIILVFLLY